MKFSAAVLGFASLASAISVTYDFGYDDPNRSMNAVSCSNGDNGLITKYGWQTQGAIPGFPFIGGYSGSPWNSPLCGTCYGLTYKGNTIYVLAVDYAAGGFNIGERAMDKLTNGEGVFSGRVDVQYAQVNVANCGL
ncbi:hypothetical protein ACEQ8H_004477 [Pleosporales sp. CAS-2024a]